MYSKLVLFAASVAVSSLAAAQQVMPGLRLYQPLGSQQTTLVDATGTVVHTWPGGSNVIAQMAADGSIVRGMTNPTIPVGGATGRLQRLAFDGTLLWDMQVDGPDYYMHHDLELMPNGNVLVIAWDAQTRADAIAAGRDPSLVTGPVWYPDSVLELQPTGPATYDIVWKWDLAEHLIQDFDATKANYGVVGNHPELLDINYPPVLVDDGDWTHFNGIDYDPRNDWIVLSARHTSEIYIIDHSTTTAEAAGHSGGRWGKGGDFLWRWGNPEAYRAGTAIDRQLEFQHDPRFVEPGRPGAGNLTVFNNDFISGSQSAAFELVVPLDATGAPFVDAATGRFGPVAPLWMYTDPSFYSGFISGVERLPNGNTLVCSGQQFELFEVDPSGTKVWSYTHDPQGAVSFGVFQAHHVERTLWVDRDTLPLAGGLLGFRHLVGSGDARNYIALLGSISGTSPGMVLANNVHLPLNVDVLTNAMITQANGGMFLNTLAVLGSRGEGSSAIAVGFGQIPPVLQGIEMQFASVVFDGSFLPTQASQPVRVTIAP
jgi:hypothetical protein